MIGHFLVISEIQGNFVYVNDPLKPKEKGQNDKLPWYSLEQKTKTHGEGDEMTKSNTLIIIKKPYNGCVTGNRLLQGGVFSTEKVIDRESKFILDPVRDRWRPSER